MKGLRLTPVSDWATGLNLSLLAQLSLCLKWFSQKGSQLRPSLSNNHSGFLCHVTIFGSQNILLMAYMFLVWHIISLVKYHFAMGNLVNMQKHPKTTSGGCFIYLYPIFSHFKFWSEERIMAAIFEPLFTKLKPTFYQSQYLSQWLSQSWDWDLLWNPLRLSPWAQVKCSNNLRQQSQIWAWDRAKAFCSICPSKIFWLEIKSHDTENNRAYLIRLGFMWDPLCGKLLEIKT